MMFRSRCLSVAAALLVTGGVAAAQAPSTTEKAAQTASAEKSTTITAKPTTITASVEAIDRAGRIVTLKGPKGNLVDIYVDESRKAFDQLKVGDKIKATYNESVLVQVRKPGDPAPKSGDVAAVAQKAGGGGGTIARQMTATVTIAAIDPAVPSVTVKDEKGREYSMRVQEPKRLAAIKVGDTVDVTYTQALLLSVEK
jgi:subtilisin family serine protease